MNTRIENLVDPRGAMPHEAELMKRINLVLADAKVNEATGALVNVLVSGLQNVKVTKETFIQMLVAVWDAHAIARAAGEKRVVSP